MKKMSRVLALILALALCFSCMAVSVFAGGEESSNNTNPDATQTDTTTGGGEGQDGNDQGDNNQGGTTTGGGNTEGGTTGDGNTTPADGNEDGDNGGDDEGDKDDVKVDILTPSTEVCGTSAVKARAFVADVSGKYRTSMTKIMSTVSPVSVATAISDNQLVIDPVTNTVGNLYDSEGNLIPCTLSSDGHFIIVPTNEGYAYIPTGK